MVEESRVNIDGSQLIIDGSINIDFEAKIIAVLELATSILVCLDYEDFKSYLNVFAVDYNGRQKWQVGEIHQNYGAIPYVGLGKDKNGNARLNNYDGFVMTVDPDTGALIKKEFLK